MDDLLMQICANKDLDLDIVKQVINIEKRYVYKTKRIGIKDDLRQIIEKAIKEEVEKSNDNK